MVDRLIDLEAGKVGLAHGGREVSLWSHGSMASWPVVSQKGVAEKECSTQVRQEEEMTRETGRGVAQAGTGAAWVALVRHA